MAKRLALAPNREWLSKPCGGAVNILAEAASRPCGVGCEGIAKAYRLARARSPASNTNGLHDQPYPPITRSEISASAIFVSACQVAQQVLELRLEVVASARWLGFVSHQQSDPPAEAMANHDKR